MLRLSPSRGFVAALLALGAAAPIAAQPSACVPQLIGGDRRGPADAISRSGNTLYLAAGAAIVVVDTTDLLNPIECGYVNLDEVVLDVAHWQTTAIALGEHGLAFIDASDLAQPEVVGTFPFPAGWFVETLTARDDLAYVPESNSLHVLDFSDPSAPMEIGDFPASDVRDVVLNGDRAYLQAGNAMLVLDITNPAAPTQMAAVPSGYPEAFRFAIAGNGSRLATSGCDTSSHHTWCAVKFYSLADPDLPVVRSELYFEDYFSITVALAWGRAYIDNGIWDLSLLSNPTPVGYVPEVWPSALSGSPDAAYLFVADRRQGLMVADVAPPNAAHVVATIEVPAASTDGYIDGSVAVVANRYGVRTFDISDPTRPTVLGSLPMPQSYLEDAIQVGDHAYVTAYTDDYALWMIDLSDPSDPHPVGSLPWQYTNRPVARNDLLIVRDVCEELGLYDVSDPALPTRVSRIPLSDQCWSIDFTADSGRLYVWIIVGGPPTYPQRLVTFDVSDPAQPIELGSAAVPPHGGTSRADAEVLFLGESDRLDVWSVSNPSQPALVGSLALPPVATGTERRISGYGARLTLTSPSSFGTYDDSLHYVDVSDLGNPTEVATLSTPGEALAAFAGPGVIVVADGPAGISIYSSCVPFADGFEGGDTAEWSDTQP